jgi:hypothetical protein
VPPKRHARINIGPLLPLEGPVRSPVARVVRQLRLDQVRELRVDVQRRRDVHDGARRPRGGGLLGRLDGAADGVGRARVVRRQQRVARVAEEGLDRRLVRRRRRVDGRAGGEAADDARGCLVGLEGDFAVREGDGALGADLARGDAEGCVAEDDAL